MRRRGFLGALLAPLAALGLGRGIQFENPVRDSRWRRPGLVPYDVITVDSELFEILGIERGRGHTLYVKARRFGT